MSEAVLMMGLKLPVYYHGWIGGGGGGGPGGKSTDQSEPRQKMLTCWMWNAGTLILIIT